MCSKEECAGEECIACALVAQKIDDAMQVIWGRLGYPT